MSYEREYFDYEPKLVKRNCVTCYEDFYTLDPHQIQCRECKKIEEAERAFESAYEDTGPQFPSL